MGDQEAGAALQQAEGGLLEPLLRGSIHTAGGLVQDEEGARLTRARAMAKSWYCPWLNSPAAPDMRVWYPWGRRWMKPWAWASFAAWTTSASVASGRA